MREGKTERKKQTEKIKGGEKLIKSLKRQKGITLIALVITIIVLIILAAVSISMLTGENGILTKANLAAEKQKIGEYKEKIELKLQDIKMDSIINKTPITTELIIQEFENEPYIKSAEVLLDDASKVELITKDNYIFEVTIGANGELTVEYIGKDDGTPRPNVEYTINPTIDTDGNVVITITATEENKGIKEIIMPDLTVKAYSGEKTVTETYTVIENGIYIFKVTGENEKTTKKTVTISNIMSAADITLEPNITNPINTNVIVTATYAEDVYVNNQIITNNNRYQYKIGDVGTWQTATQIQQITVTDNAVVYARYFDGTTGFKTITLNISNIDKVLPTAFNLSTTNTSNSITVTGSTTDTGSIGTAVANIGIRGYQFQLKDNAGTVLTNWTTEQVGTSYTFSSLTGSTIYKVSMRAVDKAGNIREATNKELSITTAPPTNPETGLIEIANPAQTTATQFTKANGVIEVAFLDTSNNVISSPTALTTTDLGGLTPIKWSALSGGTESSTTVGDSSWYSYTKQTSNTDGKTSKWANARSSNSNAYFVWIPRYAYKIIYFDTVTSKNNYRTGSGTYTIVGYSTVNGMVDITSGTPKLVTGTTPVNITGTVQTSGYKDYIPHPAFEFDGAKKGIWVGKYQASGSTGVVTIKPDVAALRYITISNMYTAALGVKTTYGLTGDSHLIKNTEWGAAAYLADSRYGRNGTEITINNSLGFYTGRAGGSVSDSTYPNLGTYTYNTAGGVLASTTGNVYGIYDMSGGAFEYVAGYVNNGNSSLTTYGANLVSAASKYKNIYSVGTSDAQSNNYEKNKNIYGDAVYEISTGLGTAGWNSDYSYFPATVNPFFIRGGLYGNGSLAGSFAFEYGAGYSSGNYGSRLVFIAL